MPMGLSTEGFSKRLVSRRSHVSKLVAVYTWVPRTLRDEKVRTGKQGLTWLFKVILYLNANEFLPIKRKNNNSYFN
jgi:hypothetical protein